MSLGIRQGLKGRPFLLAAAARLETKVTGGRALHPHFGQAGFDFTLTDKGDLCHAKKVPCNQP